MGELITFPKRKRPQIPFTRYIENQWYSVFFMQWGPNQWYYKYTPLRGEGFELYKT